MKHPPTYPDPLDNVERAYEALGAERTKNAALRERIKELETELKWAWDNLRLVMPPAADDAEYDFCVECSMPEWKHKPNCNGLAHKDRAAAILKGKR